LPMAAVPPVMVPKADPGGLGWDTADGSSGNTLEQEQRLSGSS
jgi:hypothetical protein